MGRKMKTLNTYISETLSHNKCVNEWKLTDDSASNIEKRKIKKPCKRKYFPNIYDELRELVIERYEKNNKYLDLRDIDVSKITSFGEEYLGYKYDMYDGFGLFYMFNKVEIIDVTGWDVSKVKDISYMFYNCEKLKEIKGIEDFNVSNSDTFECMFFNCKSLEKIDLSKWKLKNEISSGFQMFCGCRNLKEIKGIETWKSKLFKSDNLMFIECPAKPSWYKK